MDFLLTGSEILAQIPNFKLVGRDQELERLTSILLRSKQSSVILFGAGGVGCTALLNGLQKSKDEPNAPFDVVSKRMLWLQTDALFSCGSVDQITDNFRKIVAYLEKTPDSVLIIEDAKDFIEACRSNGCGNFINSLNNTVKTGKTQVVLETRDDDLTVVLQAHSDMRECYTLMDLSEPENGALEAIIRSNAERLQKHHGIKIADDAAMAAIEFTTKYRSRDLGSVRAQPERALTLLDRTLATYRLEAHKDQNPEDQAEVKRLYRAQRDGEIAIQEITETVDRLKKEEEERITGGEANPATSNRVTSLLQRTTSGGFTSNEIMAQLEKIKKLQAALEVNRNEFNIITARINKNLSITRDTVVSQFSLISGISVSKLNQDERKKLRGMEDALNSKVFGQHAAIAKISNAIKVARTGKKQANKPQAAFMVIGPSGTGKTEISKQLAGFLLDDAAALTRFDMSEYQEKHAVAKLIGAPPGYEGFEAGGILTNAIRKNPRRVLLFDEIEKAHVDIFDIFLQIIDDSRLTDNVGRVVSFDDCVIIMSSNVGSQEFLDETISNEEAFANAMKELEAKYRQEFLNRFNGRENIIAFNRLDLDSMAKIVRREVGLVSDRYVDDGLNLSVSDSSVAEFCKDKYLPKFGARGLVGYLKTNLAPALANLVLDNPDFKGTINAVWDHAKERFDIQTQTI